MDQYNHLEAETRNIETCRNLALAIKDSVLHVVYMMIEEEHKENIKKIELEFENLTNQELSKLCNNKKYPERMSYFLHLYFDLNNVN